MNLKQIMEKLEDEIGKYLLTSTNFGPSAYLERFHKEYAVIVDDDRMTAFHETPEGAVQEYIKDCVEGDPSDNFVTEFLEGYDEGTCDVGGSKYGHMVLQAFRDYKKGNKE